MIRAFTEKTIRSLRRKAADAPVEVRELPLSDLLVVGYKRTMSVIEGDYRVFEVGDTTATFYRTNHVPRTLPERQVFEDVIETINRGDVFYDLGANRGLYTCLVGNRLSDGTVYAYEPSPQAFSDLRKNVELNELSDHVVTSQAAISGETGSQEFTVLPDSTGNKITEESGGGEMIEVETTTLDDIVEAGTDRPTVVKMDIEGQEANALEEAETALTECRCLYCEVHSAELGTRVVEQLQDLGFREPEKIHVRDTDNYMLKTTR